MSDDDTAAGDLALFWTGEKPRFSDTRNYLVFQAAKRHASKLKAARKLAARAAEKSDVDEAVRFGQLRAEITASFATEKAKIDAKQNATAAKAADRRAREQAAAPRRLHWEARGFGITVDVESDTVAAPGQPVGRFAGSVMRVETSGQINRRVTATRLVAIGVFALAAKKKQDDCQQRLKTDPFPTRGFKGGFQRSSQRCRGS